MSQEKIDSAQFWTGITIWTKNPHVVNRRLCGVMNMCSWKLYDKSTNDICNELSGVEFDLINSKSIIELQSTILDKIDAIVISNEEFERELSNLCNENSTNCEDYSLVTLQKLLQRSPIYKECFQFVILDTKNLAVSYCSISQKNEKISSTPSYPYHIKLLTGSVVLEISDDFYDEKSLKWLNQTLMPRITRWMKSENINNGVSKGSLKLVSLDEYNNLYNHLKMKYGQNIVKIWPETTDPQKFVYEDIAIATYLILLWKNERDKYSLTKKQSFIDLGCGNGLLVYVLNSEGHLGKGIDIRKRGIWDMYPDFVKLEIKAVTPSNDCLYNDVDWIIGNHSDELTPWIPVIATRSSFNCRFFLLPCCAFDFNGKKYQRKDSSKSQYNEYLEYVMEICNECGIDTEIDRLKIPSTKRTCFIGTSRKYSQSKHDAHLTQLKCFVESKEKLSEGSITPVVDNVQWKSEFKPREAMEKVRNCTQVEKTVINSIIEIITQKLLETHNKDHNDWNAGGNVPISNMIKLIPQELLNKIKNECGGLQTLLKNNHHIFEVVAGSVKFRRPTSKIEYLSQINPRLKKGNKTKKTIFTIKPCWFYINHPDGCPLVSEECRFSHET